LDEQGLVESELCFRLTPQGRALLGALDSTSREG
jgi:hypothetical protein